MGCIDYYHYRLQGRKKAHISAAGSIYALIILNRILIKNNSTFIEAKYKMDKVRCKSAVAFAFWSIGYLLSIDNTIYVNS